MHGVVLYVHPLTPQFFAVYVLPKCHYIIHECSKKLLKMKNSNNKKLTPSIYIPHNNFSIR